MTTNTTTNWLLAIALAALLGTAHHLDGPDEVRAAMDTALAKADAQVAAQQQAEHRQRTQRAAQRACGDNAAFEFINTTTVQCLTKRGRRTQRITL